MLKRLSVLLLTLCLLPLAALCDEPREIVPLAPAQIEKTPAGIHHYLLLCSDTWKGATEEKPNNTDGIMLLTLDTAIGRVMLTSFVRDLLVLRPDGSYGRVNAVARHYSFEGLMNVINTHFGLEIDKYILVDWTGVANIIDAVGGVDITVTAGEAIRLRDKDAYKSDWTTPVLRGAGTYHFRGYAAVIFMRIRSDTSIGGERYDFRRTTRAREVVSALANGLRDVSYSEAIDLMNSVLANITATNMTMADMVEAVGHAYPLRDAQIEQLRIPIDGTSRELVYQAMSTIEIEYPPNRQAITDFLYGSFVVRDDE